MEKDFLEEVVAVENAATAKTGVPQDINGSRGASLPFWVKEKANRLKNEIREVEELDNWQPASPLIHNLLPAGSLDSPRQS